MIIIIIIIIMHMQEEEKELTKQLVRYVNAFAVSLKLHLLTGAGGDRAQFRRQLEQYLKPKELEVRMFLECSNVHSTIPECSLNVPCSC